MMISEESGLFHYIPFAEKKSVINIHQVNIVNKTLSESIVYDGPFPTSDESKLIREIAGNCPTDEIVVAINHLGGGTVWHTSAGPGDIAFVSARNFAGQIFTHELGHSFGYFIDEYIDDSASTGEIMQFLKWQKSCYQKGNQYLLCLNQLTPSDVYKKLINIF